MEYRIGGAATAVCWAGCRAQWPNDLELSFGYFACQCELDSVSFSPYQDIKALGTGREPRGRGVQWVSLSGARPALLLFVSSDVHLPVPEKYF